MPEVARECFLEVAALQLDQKDDCFRETEWKQPDARGRAVSHFIMTVLFPKVMDSR